MNEITPYVFKDMEVRSVIGDNGEPLFNAKDICDCLDIANSRDAIQRLHNDELVSVKATSGGQLREMNFVTESGLYNLIFRSNKPEAEAFRLWVTSEVLPSIRKTGGYVLPHRLDEYIASAVSKAIAGVSLSPNKRRSGTPLSGAEKRIIDELYSEYWTMSAIARELGCDVKTVSRYVGAKIEAQPVNLLVYEDGEEEIR